MDIGNHENFTKQEQKIKNDTYYYVLGNHGIFMDNITNKIIVTCLILSTSFFAALWWKASDKNHILECKIMQERMITASYKEKLLLAGLPC